jgi:hypothetical protein
MRVQILPARLVPIKGEQWLRTVTISGGLRRTIGATLKKGSATLGATLSGLTKYLIGSCITILILLGSRLLTKCIRQYTTTTKDYVLAIDEWCDMDEQNRIKCRNCGEWVYYTPANTVIYWWPDYLWYSIAQTVCDYCDYRQACFLLDNLEWELNWAVANELGFVEMEGLPQDDVLDAFKEIYPNHVTYHELSEQEQAWVDYLAYLLDFLPQDRWFE